jgi:hypothetical protein
METARTQVCACHACTQARLAKRKTTGITGWFDVTVVALFFIFGAAYLLS